MRPQDFIYVTIIVLLALALGYKQCTSVDPTPPHIIRTDTIHVPPDTIVKNIVNTKYLKEIERDTFFQTRNITKIDTIEVYDTIRINNQWTANIYKDTIKQDSIQLNWSIVTKGELLSFYPELYYLGSTEREIIRERHLYHSFKTIFLIEPLFGVAYYENSISPAYGLRLGYKDYTGSLIASGHGSMFLAGFRFRF